MPNNPWEIELRVKVQNSHKLLTFLDLHAHGSIFLSQTDYYYAPCHRDFLQTEPIQEWFRLREINGQKEGVITYKKRHYDIHGICHHSDEIEFGIQGPEQAQKILSILDFKLVITVHKTRIIYVYNDYEVAFDSVNDGENYYLGTFFEIEFKGEVGEQTPEEITQKMMDWLRSLDVGEIKRFNQGYPEMLLRR